MKPTHERHQEWLPPKKRDLPMDSSSGVEEGLGGGGVSGGEEAASTPSTVATGSEAQTSSTAGDWMRVPSGLHYGVENSDGIPVDQYGMVYKVAVPSVTYSPTSLHPVLSHISPAYTVPSPLLQHAGIPYHPLSYAQLPHPSLQFVGSPYAVPYAVPPGFVPSPLISPQSAIPQPHHVSHLVQYPPVIQEGVVSPPPQPQSSAHSFAKVPTPGGVPLMLPPEQTPQQHMGAVGGLPATDVGLRGVPVFYHPSGSRSAAAVVPLAVAHGDSQERKKEVNGGEVGRGAREAVQDSSYSSKNSRIAHVTASPGAVDGLHSRNHASFRPEGRTSPAQSSTPDTDLEVQQVVGRLASPNHGSTSSHKEASFGPLNLSQGSQRTREANWANSEASDLGRAGYSEHAPSLADPRAPPPQSQFPHKAMILANGQQVLIPLEYRHPQHYVNPPEEGATKAPDPPARTCLPERAGPELVAQQQHPHPVPTAVQAPVAAGGSSHFMKGAIIQLATGELKRVEDLQTQDFVRSAEASGGLRIDSSIVVDVHRSPRRPGLVSLHFTVGEQQSKVAIEVPPEHPFFVFGQGWSSCSPERTAQLYGLACYPLQVGDVCVSVTLQQPQKPPQNQQPQASAKSSKAKVVSQAMGPPAPQHTRPPAQFRLDRTHREREGEAEEEPMLVGGMGHAAAPLQARETSAELVRSQSGYYLHTEGHLHGSVGSGGAPSLEGAQRRWSLPGLQRYGSKAEEEAHASACSAGPSRPSFIPQEVKLSIEGRSNAGK
ncbi:LOW QUALITY PROTEIN: ataxin-1-like [Brienomyrus brachyistius]|uniref:LOW QUALITY PROTEIN: ataxin-1-like n=1 Tax=Brienomyrus brachyistius TaxID=42636 RepID=UPI0020B291CC|nr:LOW QUALITY PROTEIN: ataxin-1-like [Brienomyrus brachyistius]